MTTFAVAHLTSTRFGPGIREYLERVDDTLEPYGGRFVVHGSTTEVLQGQWQGDLIVIEFPDHSRATDWYRSAEYQEIVALRTDNSDGTVILVDRVIDPHRATDILAGLGSR